MGKTKNFFRSVWLLVMLCLSTSIIAQTVTLKGVVKDNTGEPIIGASIMVKGSSTGTITDIDGNFSLNASTNATLVVSYIGMEPQELTTKGKTEFNILLKEDSKNLDEVVVIGYGTVRKKDLTGSVSSVSGAVIAQVPVTNAAQAMAGRLAGVQVTSADGSPDAEMIIRVRGGGSVTGDNSPLYIVDGFPVGSLNDVAPGDIQSIDILKDASTTAIYGSRGANGVVLITTKSAQAGKTTVSYNGFMQTKRLARRLDVLDPHEYVMLNYELAALGGSDAISSFEKTFGVYEDLDLYRYQKAIDWQDDMFGANVVSHQHNVSIQGGNDKTRFSLSTTYNKDGGLMANNDYTRLNTNFKLNHNISKNLRFNVNARVTDTEVNGSGTSGGNYKIRTSQALTSMAVKGLSDFIEIDPSAMTDEEFEEWLRSNMTLAEQAQQYWRRRNENTFNFMAGMDWDIIKNLTYRVEGGYEYIFRDTKNYWGEYTSNASYEGGKPLVDWTKQQSNRYRAAHTLNYKLKLDHEQRFDFLIGQEMVGDGAFQNYVKATGFGTDLSPDKIFSNLGLGDGATNISSNENANNRLASFFGRVSYSLLDRYLLSVTFRADGSSKFAKGNQWGYFPAAAFAWRISEESFMAGTSDWLSNLKLRLSYGEVGNNRIANTLYKLDYKIQTAKTYGIGDKPNNFYEATNKQLPNPNLRWETTTTRNVGLDFGFLNEKISGSVEGYWNTTKDLLIESKIVAPGYSTMQENIGKTSNSGFEATFNGVILEKKKYNLNATFNVGVNRSKVLELARGIDMQEYASGWAGTDLKGYYDYQVRVGQPLGLIYGWVTDGYYTTADFEMYDEGKKAYVLKEGVATTGLLGGRAGIRPGTIKLKDLDGNGVIDDNDRTVIGNTTPKFIGGMGLNGSAYGFDVSVMFNFVYGNQIYNADKIASSQQYRTSNPNMRAYMNAGNRYTYLNSVGEIVTDLNTLAAMNEGDNAKEYWTPWSFGNATVLPHSWAIEDGSFLRLQNITVGYTLPKNMIKKVGCQQLRFYCTVNNVWTWTGYTGYDPEVSSPVRGSSSSGLTPGVDYSAYPKSLSWTFGVNMTF